MNSSTAFTAEQFKSYIARSVTYEQYIHDFASQLDKLKQNPALDPKMLEYLQINQQRIKRVDKTYSLSEELVSFLNSLPDKIHWLVISEPWCGDAAQSLPVLAKFAQASAGKIELDIVYRDQNIELIDAFQFNGTRSIPRLIQLNSQFNVNGTWGPRPAEAQLLVQTLKSDLTTAPTYGQYLHKWYAQNKQTAIQSEILSLLKATVAMKLEGQY